MDWLFQRDKTRKQRLLLGGDRFPKTRQHILRQAHLRQRKQEGQGCFRSLVPVDPIHVQPIAAAACFGRVEFQSEIVPADEPVEGALRLLVPPEVRRGAIGFKTGRDHCLRLDGLLVKVGAYAAAAIKSVAANGSKVTLLGDLQFRQPAQGLQASLKHRWLSGCTSAQNQGVRELRVIVSHILFKPAPVRLGGPFEKFHEPGSEYLTGLVDLAVTAQPAQVFMNADKTERPRPRRSELRQSWQRQREELSSHDLEAPIGRTPHAHTQRPEGSPLTIL